MNTPITRCLAVAAMISTSTLTSGYELLVSHAQVPYDQIFTALGSNLASAAAQLGDLVATTAGTKSAEYVVIRTVNGVDRAFFLYAIRAEDGIWRLESM